MESAVTLLPQPLSPTSATVDAARHVERDAVDRADDAPVGAEGRHQIADAEERRVVHPEAKP